MKNLIKLLSIIVLAVSLMMAGTVSAQTTKAEKKEKKELKKDQKELRESLYQKADKQALKEEKRLKKEGWQTLGLPIAKQLEEMWMKQYDKDASGLPRYIWSEQFVTARTFTAAQSQADALARMNIAGSMSSSVAMLIDEAVANHEISAKESETYQLHLANAKILVAQKLGRTFKVLELYQELSNGNIRVRTCVVYDMKAAIAIAREVMLEELKKDSDINKAQLEKIMGMDKITEQVAKDMLKYDEVIE